MLPARPSDDNIKRHICDVLWRLHSGPVASVNECFILYFYLGEKKISCVPVVHITSFVRNHQSVKNVSFFLIQLVFLLMSELGHGLAASVEP